MSVPKIEERKNNNLSILLRAIHDNEPSDALLAYGLIYSQISDLIAAAVRFGLLTVDRRGLNLTNSGREYLAVVGRKSTRYNADTIRPLDQMRVDQSSVNDIYLPYRHVVRSFRGIRR